MGSDTVVPGGLVADGDGDLAADLAGDQLCIASAA
jgi:hypothetical protein